MRYVLAAFALTVSLAACGGSDSETAPVEPGSVSPQQVADRLGCVGYGDQEAEELFAEKAGGCMVGDSVNENVRILTFANNESRDNFVTMAREFGNRYVVGDLFAVEVESPEAESVVTEKLG